MRPKPHDLEQEPTLAPHIETQPKVRQVGQNKEAENTTKPLDDIHQSLQDMVSQPALLTFSSATITITAPSIIISPSVPPTVGDDNSDDEYIKGVCSSFEKFEEQQEKLVASSYEKADGLLLTMSSGILGLSATFLGQLFGKRALTHRWEVYSGWGSLGLTVALVLASYLSSRKSLSASIVRARAEKDTCLAKDEDEKVALSKQSEKAGEIREQYRICTEVLNSAAALTFVVGLVMIVLFAITNMH